MKKSLIIIFVLLLVTTTTSLVGEIHLRQMPNDSNKFVVSDSRLIGKYIDTVTIEVFGRVKLEEYGNPLRLKTSAYQFGGELVKKKDTISNQLFLVDFLPKEVREVRIKTLIAKSSFDNSSIMIWENTQMQMDEKFSYSIFIGFVLWLIACVSVLVITTAKRASFVLFLGAIAWGDVLGFAWGLFPFADDTLTAIIATFIIIFVSQILALVSSFEDKTIFRFKVYQGISLFCVLLIFILLFI